MKKIYYGWYIIAACFLSSLYVAGIVVFGFTAFFDPFIREFGWSYAQVSLAVSLRGAETGLVAPLLGFMVDRWGSRWLLFSGAILVGISLIILSQMHSLVSFYGASILLAVGTSLCSPSVVTPSATNWFRRRLGIATGILAAGFGFGGLLLPIITGMLDNWGWRDSLLYLGIGSFIIGIPLALVVRHRPEQYGYGPDGEPLPALEAAGTDAAAYDVAASYAARPVKIIEPAVRDYTTREALASRSFWQMTLGFVLQYVVVGAVLAHIMPFLTSIDFDRSTAAFFAAAIPVVSILGRLGAGWASDKMDRKKLAVIAFSIVGVGTFLFDLSSINTIWVLALAVLLFGISYGTANTLRAVLLREYFGRTRFGTIFGFVMGFLSVGVILGPYLAGWIFDRWQSYHYTWWIFTALNALALLLVLTLPRPGPARPRSSHAA